METQSADEMVMITARELTALMRKEAYRLRIERDHATRMWRRAFGWAAFWFLVAFVEGVIIGIGGLQ